MEIENIGHFRVQVGGDGQKDASAGHCPLGMALRQRGERDASRGREEAERMAVDRMEFFRRFLLKRKKSFGEQLGTENLADDGSRNTKNASHEQDPLPKNWQNMTMAKLRDATFRGVHVIHRGRCRRTGEMRTVISLRHTEDVHPGRCVSWFLSLQLLFLESVPRSYRNIPALPARRCFTY